ncbi:MAG: complex I subunit 1 family protein [Clostridia bacterium]
MALIKIFIFPGFLFLAIYGLWMEFVDRKVYARLQNRIGPPWYQPLADFLKLLGKETIVPYGAKGWRLRIFPVISLASVAAAFIYVPVWGLTPASHFEGDLVIVLYLSMIPALCAFLAGWYSRSVYATIGATRTLTQLFSYEVPLFIALLSPALLAQSWSITGVAEFYSVHPLLTLVNLPAFFVTLTAAQGKLERVPFDQSEAETEIVSGVFVEYSGKLYAIFRLSANCELVLLVSMMSAVFLPFFTGLAWLDFILYFVKTGFLLMMLTLMRATMARLRMEQMVNFCWKLVSPIALLQMLLNILIRGGLQL